MKSTEPDPDLLTELYEALNALAAAVKALKAAKRALFPAIQAQRRSTKRILDIWRQMRGAKRPPPALPILDAIESRLNGHAVGNGLVHVQEELPDGGKPARPRRKPGPPVQTGHLMPGVTTVAAPAGGWTPPEMLEAARLILGPEAELEWDQLQELVVCTRKRCRVMRRFPMDARLIGGKCPVCGCRGWEVYSVAAGEFERRQEQLRPKAPKRRRRAVV